MIQITLTAEKETELRTICKLTKAQPAKMIDAMIRAKLVETLGYFVDRDGLAALAKIEAATAQEVAG